MDTRDCLLLLVFDHLDELTHQLVFADWLDENGREDQATALRLGLRQLQLSRRGAEATAVYEHLGPLRQSHREEWQEHAGVTLTHDDFLLLFRWRLAESRASTDLDSAEDLVASADEVLEEGANREVAV